MRCDPFLPCIIPVLLVLLSPAIAAAADQLTYQYPDLPPLLPFLDGTRVRTLDDFERRKDEIRDLFETYFFGTFPKKPPGLLTAKVLDEKQAEDGSTRRRVKLTFGTPNKASMEVRVWIPKGKGPFPLLLTQPRFYQIFWATLWVEWSGYTRRRSTSELPERPASADSRHCGRIRRTDRPGD